MKQLIILNILLIMIWELIFKKEDNSIPELEKIINDNLYLYIY